MGNLSCQMRPLIFSIGDNYDYVTWGNGAACVAQ
jgi:hypothetical protein